MVGGGGEMKPESIELFIEGHSFLPSYDLAPPLSHQQVVFLGLPVRRWSSLLTGKFWGEGVRVEPNHTTPWESLAFYKLFNTLWMESKPLTTKKPDLYLILSYSLSHFRPSDVKVL